MKEIIFISKEYFPVSNGTTACLENILPSFTRDYKVRLFAAQTEVSGFTGEKDGIQIIRYKCWSDKFVLKKQMLLKKIQLAGIGEMSKKIITWITKVIFYPFQCHSILWGYIQPESFSKNIVKRILKNENIEKAEIVMAVGGPFENAAAAAELKRSNPKLKLIYIFFDLFTYNPVSIKKDRSPADLEFRLTREEEWMQLADAVFCAAETKSAIMNSKLKKYEDKYHFLFIPSLKIHSGKMKNMEKEIQTDIVIVYAGTFYTDIRNPLYMLQIFQNIILSDQNIKLHILGFGCEDMINTFQNKMGSNLVVHGQKDKHFTNDMLECADFLLSVGNNTSTQLPSKIMEYIGMGKPIIHISSIEEDTCEKYLENYPLKCIVNEKRDSINEASKKINDFLKQRNGELCNTKEIETLYGEFLPQHFANEILKTFVN